MIDAWRVPQEEKKTDYISREALLRLIDNKPSSPTTEREDRLINGFISTVRNFPAADVREVKRGRWVETKTGFHCSACKSKAKGTKAGALLSSYCPNCGARMVNDE